MSTKPSVMLTAASVSNFLSCPSLISYVKFIFVCACIYCKCVKKYDKTIPNCKISRFFKGNGKECKLFRTKAIQDIFSTNNWKKKFFTDVLEGLMGLLWKISFDIHLPSPGVIRRARILLWSLWTISASAKCLPLDPARTLTCQFFLKYLRRYCTTGPEKTPSAPLQCLPICLHNSVPLASGSKAKATGLGKGKKGQRWPQITGCSQMASLGI